MAIQFVVSHARVVVRLRVDVSEFQSAPERQESTPEEIGLDESHAQPEMRFGKCRPSLDGELIFFDRPLISPLGIEGDRAIVMPSGRTPTERVRIGGTSVQDDDGPH